MNGDLISRSALLRRVPVNRNDTGKTTWDWCILYMADIIKTIPAVDAVVLPCMVGKIVWKIDERFVGRGRERWPILRCLVTEFSTDIVDTYAVLSGAESWFAMPRFAAVPISDFGKTVFLTREEAEAALKRRADDE